MSMFDNAAVVEDTVWSLRLADYPRSLNRADINNLFNGAPPYTPEQAEQNKFTVNVNDMAAPTLAHDARRQFGNAFTKPGNYFTVTCDRGPQHKRKQYSSIITREMNRIMKRSLPYYEMMRAQFANVVLHGIGPCVWNDRYSWCPDPLGVEDVMIPGGTTLTMRNLNMFAVFRPYTAMQLRKLTTGPKVDPAWNMKLVDQLIENAEKQILDFGIPYSEIYSPEKMAERIKSDGGFVSGDSAPTIDAWDFYFWNDEDKVSGWNRRVVLDANWQGGYGAFNRSSLAGMTSKVGTRDEFLYYPGKRKYGEKLGQLIHFQFGDLSAVAPFHYHSVRGLGFLMFAICHLQNRLRCRFNESLFEHMLQYFRVKTMEDVERALKINLINNGFVDETVQFIPANERWQISPQLVEMGLQNNQQIIGQNSASFIQNYDFSRDKAEKTATQVMAETQATTALVSAALMQAYEYQKFQYFEIARRFCIKHSKDGDVRKFRVNVLKQGVPEELLDSECWDIDPERVMGSGNKMLEVAISEKLMAVRQQLDPEPQRQVTRDYILAISDDAAMARQLVPDEPMKVTDSVHDAQLVAGALMMGLKVDVKTGMNHIEYVETLLAEMATIVKKIEGRGGMAIMDEVIGLNNMAVHIAQHIDIIGQDKAEQERVREYGDDLGKLMNLVKAYEQRINEQQESKQGGNGGLDPKDAAKIAGKMIEAKAKAANMRESHAARTAQKQTQWEMQVKRDEQAHELEMKRKAMEHALDIEATAAKTQLQSTKSSDE